jgi:hypothetical protein
MRKVIVCLLVALFYGCAKMDAQTTDCASTIYNYGFSCQSGQCHASGDGQTPSGLGGIALIVEPITCCGQGGFTSVEYNGYCGYAELKDPAVERRLLDLARTEGQEFIIASCKGSFVPLADAIGETAPILSERRTPLF